MKTILALSAALCLQASAGIQYVIAISVDGLRGDFLETFVVGSPATFPNFARLKNTGASTFNARCDYDYSETVPNHIAMISGRPVIQPGGLTASQFTGFTTNYANPSPADNGTDTIDTYVATSGVNSGQYKASIFDMVHDRGMSTAILLGKTRITILDRSFNTTNGALDVTGTDNGRDKIDFAQIQNGTTSTLISTLTARITGSTLEKFTFLHITDPDTTGHASSWTTTVGGAYRNTIITVDGYLGSIFAALDGNATLAGKVAIILTADHGGGGVTSNAHTEATAAGNYTIPFFVVSPGVPAGSDLYSLFDNRVNPGATRPTFLAAAQPVHNADIANLSAELIGVPQVTNSFLKPSLKKPVTVSADPSGNPTVNWPIYLTGWTLESCDDLAVAVPVWVTVTTGIAESATLKTHTVTPAPAARFFRLRSPL